MINHFIDFSGNNNDFKLYKTFNLIGYDDKNTYIIYLKPQFNYLSLFSEEELINKDEDLKKIYNYYSQTPEHLEDFYNKKYKLNML